MSRRDARLKPAHGRTGETASGSLRRRRSGRPFIDEETAITTRIRAPRPLRLLAAVAAAVGCLAASVLPLSPATAAEPLRVEMTPALQAEIQRMLEEFVAAGPSPDRSILGMSAAVVTPRPGSTEPVITTFVVGRREVATDAPAVDAATQFELGSESKAFTADLLAHLVAEGRVSLDDPVQDYAPTGVTVPRWTDGTQITLGNLATHQAALPDLPLNTIAVCNDQPPCYDWRPGYTQAMLWDAVQNQTLLYQPGTNWLYSNFGFGLLGTILANVVDPSVPSTDPPAYQAALDGAFLDSLGMTATELEQGTPNFAPPYFRTATDPYNERASLWENVNALAGGGGLISNATDMGTWVAAHLGYVSAGAAPGVRTLADTLQPVADITTSCTATYAEVATPPPPPPVVACQPDRFRMGLAWQLYGPEWHRIGVDTAYKNGGTNGSSTDTVLAPGERTGVTTMFNQKRENGDEIATAIMALLIANRVDPSPRTLPVTGADAPGLAVLAAAGALLVAGGVLTLRRRPARRG